MDQDQNENTRPLITNTFLEWLPLGFVVIMVIIICYLMIIFYIRQSANMPQLQIAQDKARVLSSADAVQISLPNVEIDKSLQTFEIIYDGSGKVLSSNAMLQGLTPELPSTVLRDISTTKTVTWQPQKSVRIAAVIQPIVGSSNAKFVLVGRNLTENQRQESNILTIAITGAVAITFLSFGVMLGKNYFLAGYKT